MVDFPMGPVVRAARKEKGLTQTALAEMLGVSVSYVNLIERDRRIPTLPRKQALADILDLDPEALGGEAERQLMGDLDELSADPVVTGLKLEDARDFVARHGDWARALVAMRRAAQRDQTLVTALSDRLNHDPLLNDSMHEMLNAATAVRSVADIYADTPDLPPDRRARFDAILLEEASRLAEVAQSLAGFFERSDEPGTALTAAEELDDFLYDRRNHFPALEAAMEGLLEGGQPPSSARLAEMANTVPQPRQPRATQRFQLARTIAGATVSEVIDAEIASAPMLTSDASQSRARRTLMAYAAACLVMPYAAFHAAAERRRYDIDALTIQFDASPEQLCHRLTTLRRPGAEGVPFAFLRANAAGYLTKRFPLPRFPIPRFGGACPLWAVYSAMHAPDVRQRQLAEFPNGDRFFIIARATRPVATAFGRRQPGHALMLACDALNAERLVYSDGLDLSSGVRAEPIGSTCLLCPRTDCVARQEPSARAAGQAARTREH